MFTITCKQTNKHENQLVQGVIEFDAKVVDEKHPMAGLAPSSATVKFKNNKFEFGMSTMGIFNTNFISNPTNKTLIQLVKFMDIKDACTQTEKDLVKDNEDFKLKFTNTLETKKIAGYNCKKIIATLVYKPTISFDVYYTTDIATDSVNFLSPYKEIKGMLMDYRLKKLGLEMRFIATAVKPEEITDETFEIPAGYKKVTSAEMAKLFSDIQN